MNKLGSNILLFYIKLSGLMPWWWLHYKASVLAFIMTHIKGYRSKVVDRNLQLVFGDNRHKRSFYKNFCDIVVESLKIFSLREEEARHRVDLVNAEVLHKLYDEGRNVVLAAGHMANWEIYGLALPGLVRFETGAIYKTLSNEVIDKAMKTSRSRAGMTIMEMSESRKWMDARKEAGSGPALVGYVFDQSPPNPNRAWWTTFLGVETPFFAGLDNYTKRYDAAVVYAAVKRTSRGRYELDFKLVLEDINSVEKGEVLDRCLGLLEEEIMKEPGNWLWSHNRWKHLRPEGDVLHKRKFCKFESWT
jgi:KDO2-lipid IV(A) lauroyltransferase